MAEGSVEEESYVSMLDKLCSMTYGNLEDVKAEMKKQKLLRGQSSREDPDSETWLIEYNFLINQMKNPQVGYIDRKDTIFQKKCEKNFNVINESLNWNPHPKHKVQDSQNKHVNIIPRMRMKLQLLILLILM